MTRDELIEKMCDAHNGICEEDQTLGGESAMGAALDVVLNEVLIEPANSEIYVRSDLVIASRRAHYQKVKTPEERISIGAPQLDLKETMWKVYLDDKWQANQASRKDAEIYCLGLIQKLKEEQG